MNRSIGVLVTMLILVWASVWSSLAECTLTRTTFEGEPALVVENEWIRLRVRSTIGGRIDGLVYKPTDTHLTARDGGAIFADRVWNYANSDFYQQWMKAIYTAKVEQSPERVAITLTAPGSVGIGRAMTFTKTFTITAGSSAIRADYRFSVGQELMVPQRIGLWWHNFLGIPQEATTYFVPTVDGVKSVVFPGGGEYWWTHPSRGWVAMAGESGTGAAAIMEFPPLMLIYNYMRGEVGSAEWAFRSREIPNGGSMETTAWLLPFSGITSVAGAGERFVAMVDGPAEVAAPGDAALKVRLTAPVSWTCTVKPSLRRMPDGEPIALDAFPMDLEPGAVAEHALTVSLPQAGTWLLTCEVYEGAKFEGDFFHETVVGEASGPVQIALREQIVGNPDETFADKIAARGTGPEDRAPSEEIVTPHVEWAKPLAGGPIKALILCDWMVGREVIELAERLDMDYTAPTIGIPRYLGYTSGMFGTARTIEQVMDDLRKYLQQDWDVILIGGLRGDIFADDVMDAILEKVRGGTGLVWANPNNCPPRMWEALPFDDLAGGSRPVAQWRAEQQHWLTAGIPWDALPPTSMSRYNESGEVLARAGKYPLLAVNDYGQGRVVALGYNTSWQGPGSYSTGLTPWILFAPTRFAYWEYYHCLLAKSMMWAGRREPEVEITALAVEPAEEVQGEAAGSVRVTLANSGDEATLTAAVRVVDEFGTVEDEFTHELRVPAGESGHDIALPADLPGGLHLADLILRAGGKVMDFGSASFTVRPRVEVASIATDDDRIYRGGDTVEATVTLHGIAPDDRQVTLRATLRDDHGRIIAEQSRQAPGEGETSMSLGVPEPLTTLDWLRVEVLDGAGAVLDAAEHKVLTMPRRFEERTWKPWCGMLWGNPAGPYSREYLIPAAAAQVRKLGIDTILASGNWLIDEELRNAFEHGFRLQMMNLVGGVLRVGHVRGEGKMGYLEQRQEYARTGDKKFLQRPYCLNDQAVREDVAATIKRITDAAARYRPVGYNCGDELSITYYVTPYDYDFTPVCLDRFRNWLRDRYGTLAALNAEWQTDFATWDEVTPMTADEVRDHPSYAPWADHRTFMEFTFADFLRFADETLESFDPGARIGVSGTQAAEAYGGWDWYRLTHVLDYAQTYDHQSTGEMHRSFGTDFVTAPWEGYAQVNPAMRHRVWFRLLNDNDGMSYYTYSYLFWPDYTLTQSTADAVEALRDINNGVASLLKACDERAIDVMVHYSHPSIHGAFITGTPKLFRDNRNAWVDAIEDNGLQMEFLAYGQIEDGELTERMPAALVLPCSIALSDAEVAEIRAYVEAGGTIIADARCGLMDEHCALRSTGALDDLFGIRRDAVDPRASRPEGSTDFSGRLEDCDPTGISIDGFGGETGISLASGQALGRFAGQPALIVNQVGRGRAVLLNMFLDSYSRRKNLGIAAPMRRLVGEVLQLAGIAPPIEARVAGEHDLYIARYLSGEATYVGVLRDRAEGRSAVSLRFPRSAHLYDTRAGKYLGETDRTEVVLDAGECKLYALLPYRVNKVRIRPRTDTVHPGDEVEYLASVDVSGGERGMHVFRIEVTGPDGETRDWYGAQLVADKGVTGGSFHLALNDQPGDWTITATDIATGATGRAKIRVAK
ncbi:MAG: beta-galactosidase [Armatimonadetes bacterium]|nr:beta-galactosidase [Armatimonadota bacterium]